jgi:hypothetical protein
LENSTRYFSAVLFPAILLTTYDADWRLWHFGAGIIFLILAHPVYQMWIIQEPNTLELWKKLYFEEKKREYISCLKFSVSIFVE